MPLSSVLGASTLIKPGVVTSSTRPAVPYEGQLIYETDTDRIAAYNGSAWVTQNGLQLIKTQTIGSAVSSVAVTDVFSSTYDAYKIIVSGGAGSADLTLRLQIGSSTTGYYGGFSGVNASGTTDNLGINNAANMTYAGYGNTSTIGMNCEVINPNLAERTNISAIFARNVSGTQGYGVAVCELADTTQHTGFTILTSTGTVTGGTIRVYGYANN